MMTAFIRCARNLLSGDFIFLILVLPQKIFSLYYHSFQQIENIFPKSQFEYSTNLNKNIKSLKIRIGPMPSYSSKNKDNIDILIQIGEYKLQMSIPRQTKVSSLLTIVKNYQKIHNLYAPMDSFFIGLCSKNGNPVIDYWLTQSQLDFCTFRKKLQLKALYSIEKSIEKLTISEFQFLKCLGKGAYGEVYLVRNKVTGYLFALKRLKKQSINQYKAWESIIRQKKILSMLPHNPHTVKFHGIFQSQSHFNFLLDYYPGGQLFLHLSSQSNRLTERQAKIYFCEVLLAMEYLHKQKILYRDLKPQNILVDIQGHLRITDFGLSKCGFEQQNVAYSNCGSAQYMAPEVLEGQSYNFSADFYSIGVILYELLTGFPAYYGCDQESGQKLEQIKSMNLDFSIFQSIYLQQLLRNLLNPEPQKRLCNYQQIKNSPWLADIDWKQIQAKKNNLRFAPDIYKSYIGQQFLALQEQVEEMNMQENQQFEHLFQGLFDFIKQKSKPMVLGIRESNISKTSLDSLNQFKHQNKQNISQKRKTHGFIKQKLKNHTKHKQNYSIQLFEKEDSTNSSHSNSTQNSNCSNLPYNPKSTRNKQTKNKQNILLFKKSSTKKLMTINDTIGKISKQPSQKKLLKQPSQTNLVTKQPSQKFIIKQPSTPIRLNTHCNTSIQGISETRKQEIKNQMKLHLISKSKDVKQNSKRQALKQTESYLQNSKNASKSKINAKSQLKQKSKSKQKLLLKPRQKQNFFSIAQSSKKAKLPTCTYKIKLM